MSELPTNHRRGMVINQHKTCHDNTLESNLQAKVPDCRTGAYFVLFVSLAL